MTKKSTDGLLLPLLVEVHDGEHGDRVLVGLVVFERFDESVKFLLFTALRQGPLAGVRQRSNGGEASLYHPLSVAIFQLLQAPLDVNLAVVVVGVVIAACEIVVFALDLTVLVDAHDLEGNVAVGCHRLIVVMMGHRGLLCYGAALLGLGVQSRIGVLVLRPRPRQEVLHLGEVAVLCPQYITHSRYILIL
jgi:hypothetical protein